ncbi:MAG: hydrogenase formation protein HypD [Spirochaetales bacterium]|nr:hydrogenase formation protein HypD [Spirochaetales bacterium]
MPMSESRNRAKLLAHKIREMAAHIDQEINIMEVCGTHTVALRREGIHGILPPTINLVSGPGCPVCVTPANYIDNALELIKDGAVIATFGDMLKVPSSTGENLAAFMGQGKVRTVYSPFDIIRLRDEIQGPLVFLGIGFETTIPTIAATFKEVLARKLSQTYLYTAFKTVPNALRALLADKESRVNAFLLPGHVSVVIGERAYDFLKSYKVPSVISGFKGEEMLTAIAAILKQFNDKAPTVENRYHQVVSREGNPKALAVMDELLCPEDALWRGFGLIKESGLKLRKKWAAIDAARVFGLSPLKNSEPPGCCCAQVVQGKIKPNHCPLFGRGCTPEDPVGPCMVSSEGSCAAYFKYLGVEA